MAGQTSRARKKPAVLPTGSFDTVILRDGTQAVLRPVRPSDKDVFRRGFARLSRRSKYLRFHAAKQGLTGSELRYFTEVDGVNHYAVTALIRVADGSEAGAGVARFVRLLEGPGTAEAAIIVVDEYQRRGLGTALFRHLATAGRQRSVITFRFEVLAENLRMRSFLRKVAPAARCHRAGSVIVFELDLA